PWVGLDPGWVEALVQATDQGRSFGSDVVFTFGPYHQLYTGQLSENLNCFVFGRWIYGLGWGAAMLSVRQLIGQPLSWLYLLLVALLSAQRLDTLFASFCFTVVFTAILRFKQAPIALPSYLCLTTSLWIGIFTKLSFTPAAAAALLVLAGVELSQPRLSPLRKLIQAILIPGTALLALAPSGMDPAQAWTYISGANRHVVSGYSEAMALHRRKNDWMQLPYWLGAIGTGILALQGIQSRLRITNRWLLLPIAGLLLLLFWAPFKAGMVRHDGGHAPMAGLFLLTAAVLVALCCWQQLRWRSWTLTPLLLIPAAIGYDISANKLDWDLNLYRALHVQGLQAFIQANSGSAGQAKLNQQRHNMLDHLASRSDLVEQFALPPGSRTDLLPWDTTDLVANGLRYTPRPMPHSLNAYSPELLELNRAFFSATNQQRPDFVILSRNMIDNRWPSVGLDGPALSEIARHYQLRNRGSKGSLVLELANQPVQVSEHTLLEGSFDLRGNRNTSAVVNLPADLPAGTSISFHFEPTWLYKLSKLLYRPPFVVRVRVNYADGHFEAYRLVPAAAQQLPLAPVPANNDELLQYLQARQQPPTGPINPASTPTQLKLQLRWKGQGQSPPLSRYFSKVSYTLQAPSWKR
ncbi:MAG: hypothetical protein VKJ87_03340, partial [Synechococcus sp.]|nr:hypothetical protein [Synechococcus sp.]